MKKYFILILTIIFFSCTPEQEECECNNGLGTIVYPCEFSSPCD